MLTESCKNTLETLPYELVKCLSRLNAVSNEAWSMVESSRDVKEMGAALALASKTTIEIIDVVTNNKPLVYGALKAAAQADEESPEQDQEQEGGDEDDIEKKKKKNQRVLASKNIRTKEPEDPQAVF
jgi:hypothetical protein